MADDSMTLNRVQALAQIPHHYDPSQSSAASRASTAHRARVGSVLLIHGFSREEDVERAEPGVLGGIDEADWPKLEQTVIQVHDKGGRCAAIASALVRRGFHVATDQDPAMRGTPVRLVGAGR